MTRGAPAGDVRPAPDSELSAPPRELAWPGAPGATGYRVRLYDARAEPLWESGLLEEPRIEVPTEAISIMEAAGEGAAFLWTVEIEGPPTRDPLGPFWFRVAP